MMFDAVDRAMVAGHDPWRLATDLLQRLRDLVYLSTVPEAATKALIDAPRERLEAMTAQAEGLGAARATRLSAMLIAGLVEMRGNVPPRLALERLCAQMVLHADGGPPRRFAQPDLGRTAPRSNDSPQRSDEPPTPAAPSTGRTARLVPDGPGTVPSAEAMVQMRLASASVPNVGVDEMRRAWPRVLAAVQLRRRTTCILLEPAAVVALDSGVLHLRMPSEGMARRVLDPRNVDPLQVTIREVLGVDRRIQCHAGPGQPTAQP
jgi:DNA polymerase-3 subunit gamma/tau